LIPAPGRSQVPVDRLHRYTLGRRAKSIERLLLKSRGEVFREIQINLTDNVIAQTAQLSMTETLPIYQSILDTEPRLYRDDFFKSEKSFVTKKRCTE
jgi:hypothetical protein